MVLVLIFLGICIFSLLLFLVLLCSTLKINIKEIKLENVLHPQLTYDYKLKVGIYLFSKIPIFVISVGKEKLQKTKIMKKLETVKLERKITGSLDILKSIKLLSPKIESLNLELAIGTEDAVYTAAIVFIISLLFSLGLPYVVEKKNREKIKYEIAPLYTGKNLFHFELRSIIYVKMVHIITIIYIYLRKRREEKNERTSNRRAYANCHE